MAPSQITGQVLARMRGIQAERMAAGCGNETTPANTECSEIWKITERQISTQALQQGIYVVSLDLTWVWTILMDWSCGYARWVAAANIPVKTW